MKSPDNNPHGRSFEEFRREKRRRKIQHETITRGASTKRDALTEIQYHEQMELIERRIQREMHEFFSEARKLALSVLQEVTEEQAVALTRQVYEEMAEFLRLSLKRAETLVKELREKYAADPDSPGVADLETSIRNLSGEALDRFRAEGTANILNKHLGEDPFSVPAQPDKPDEKPKEDASMEPAVSDAIRVLMEKGILDGEMAERIQVRRLGKKS